jgi:wyosine [tRNA(Phe)-imidazoG37] synthetase (radical SAM superfamily)
MKNIFGPVNSRRFGVSLGIDLSPSKKQCNFDCLYCELEKSKVINKQDSITDIDEIFNELKTSLKTHENVEVITFTANGEPTLYPYLDELLSMIDKVKKDKKTLILSNSTGLLHVKSFNTLLKFDKVKLSLDAASQKVFKKIDRAEKSIHVKSIINELINFSSKYEGELYIEILFVKGINDTLDEIRALSEILLHVTNIKRVDIGTIDRPPAYDVEALSYGELLDISREFDSLLPIHVASRKNIDIKPTHYKKDDIINTLDKRPLSSEDVDLLFDDESKVSLDKLVEDGFVVKYVQDRLEFYKVAK